MALSSTKDLLLDAQKNGYAVCAFNAENMEMCMAIIKTAERLSAPVIIQTTPSSLGYAEPEIFAAMVKAMVRECKTPVALHLDHGNSYELALRCADAGYTPMPYFWCRIIIDSICTILTLVFGGLVGLGTLACSLGLGPFISFFSRTVASRLCGMRQEKQ